MSTITREQATQILREKNELAKALLDEIVANAEKGTTYDIRMEIRVFVRLESNLKKHILDATYSSPPQ
jgi:hypothetical protein